MKQLLLTFFVLIGLSQLLHSQSITNFQAEGLRDSVAISYELTDAQEGRWFRVQAQGIIGLDTFLLTKISGNGIGDSLQAGTHAITWNARKELGRFRGNISFRILAVPYFYFEQPTKEGLTLKRDKPFTFQWYGGNSTLDTLRLELFQYDKKVAVIGQTIQAPNYTWKVPIRIPTGEGYRLKVIGTELSGLEAFTPSFTIKRKIPLYQMIVPAAIVAVGVPAFLILRRKPLPGAPGDPDNPNNPAHQTTYPIPK